VSSLRPRPFNGGSLASRSLHAAPAALVYHETCGLAEMQDPHALLTVTLRLLRLAFGSSVRPSTMSSGLEDAQQNSPIAGLNVSGLSGWVAIRRKSIRAQE